MKQRLKVYEYPLKDGKGQIYYGSYTIKNEIEPLGFKGERLVQKFTVEVEDMDKKLEQLEDKLYWVMCRNCPNARKCHEECETCEEFDKELDRLVNESK